MAKLILQIYSILCQNSRGRQLVQVLDIHTCEAIRVKVKETADVMRLTLAGPDEHLCVCSL